MKKGILLLNGEPYLGEIDDAQAMVVCCDGAYRWAHKKVRIDENVGDFDSLDVLPVPAPKEVYPKEKDLTDGELALLKLIDAGCQEIEIYGGGGGREDHFLGNLHLLYFAKQKGVLAKMITNRSYIYPVFGRVELNDQKGKTISLLPFGAQAHIIDGEGFLYPYDRLMLSYGCCRGISNVITSDKSWFICDQGVALLIVNEGPLSEV